MNKIREIIVSPDVEIADKIQELQIMLLDKGVKLEHIKISGPLFIDGKKINSLSGVEIKEIIFEHDATLGFELKNFNKKI